MYERVEALPRLSFCIWAGLALSCALCRYTACVHLAVKTYHFGTSPFHQADPRIKIALLLAYSITLFLLETWTGLAIAAVLYALAHAISRVPFRSVFVLAAPTYVLVAVAIAFCSFTCDV